MASSEAPGVGHNITRWGCAYPGGSSVDAAVWSSVTGSVVKMVLISLIVCASLFGNVVVLLVFQRKPQLLHVANRFVLNLLLADLLQTVLVMPFAIAATLPSVWPLDARLCQALVVLMHTFAFASVNTIIVVSVDRYLAIIHPLSYPTRMTPHLGTNLIACTWVLGVLQSTPPLYGWGAIGFDTRHKACAVAWSSSASYAALVAVCSFWLPVLIMLACYWMVFRAARRQNALVHPVQAQAQAQVQAQVQAQASLTDPHPACTPHTPDVPSSSAARVRHRRFQYHCKAARVVFVIVASYVLSMGPYSVLSSASVRWGEAAVPPWLASAAMVLFFLQCCLHPYIYGYMHRSVRKEFLALLCGSFCKLPGQSSTAESCFTGTDGRAGSQLHHHHHHHHHHHQLPSLASRVFPLHTWEEGTTSSSPTLDRKSRDSRKETTSVSLSSEKELTLHSK